MLNKLKKIDEKPKKLVSSIKNFLKEYSVLGIAIGVIFAQSAKSFIDSLVSGFFLPLISLFMPSKNLTAKIININGAIFDLGSIFNSGLSLLIVIFILYLIVKKILKTEK